jgi:hypothetical protein
MAMEKIGAGNGMSEKTAGIPEILKRQSGQIQDQFQRVFQIDAGSRSERNTGADQPRFV